MFFWRDRVEETGVRKAAPILSCRSFCVFSDDRLICEFLSCEFSGLFRSFGDPSNDMDREA